MNSSRPVFSTSDLVSPMLATLVLAAATAPLAASGAELECKDWQTKHPEWIWCDDFESDAALEQNYFDVERQDGRFRIVTNTAFGGLGSLRGTYLQGVTGAGSAKLSFGKTPVSPKRYTDRNFEDIYWRFYMKTSPNWVGNGIKVSRATIFTGSNWSQAAIGHLWENSPTGLAMGIDPASGVVGSSVVTTKYNDFDHLKWLGKRDGTTQVYGPDNRDKWTCVEVRMKLNTPGQSDGEMAFWVNGHLEAKSTGLNLRGSYTTYGINAILLENYINGGAPQTQDRYFDNFVVSTAPIGCLNAVVKPNPPTNVITQ